ncbi:MAG: DegV family protein [Pelotomaculum thermopropionicum]|uniref:DegV family protein n=1 Tax=Pelotomaculum thermopropionicum TaxID=110500 RepID=A0A101HVD5_9FIRM|nr:MAG: DegV family protein [Pelotomaculum thermopropionicum]
MNRIRIVTDSTADLPKEFITKYKITVIPLKIIFGEKEIFRDGIDITTEQLYKQMEKNKIPGTSQPAPTEFVSAYQELAKDGSSIISIHISSAMSGTYQSAILAKEMVPDLDIEVIDSRQVSMALGLIVLKAAKAVSEGKTKPEILKIINHIIPEIQVYFIVDTLKYLKHGGRIGRAEAFLGTILNVKPILHIKDGLVQPYEKVRSKIRAIERLVQIYSDYTGSKKTACSMVHGMNPAAFNELVKKITPVLNCDEPIFSTLGSVVGTHVGPGIIGIIFAVE